MRLFIVYEDDHVEQEVIVSKLFLKERRDDFDLSFDSEMFGEMLSSHRRIDIDKISYIKIIFEDD